MKKWILSKFFQDDIKEAKIVAFRDAQKDILETMNDDLEKRADELAKKKLQDLLSPIDWNYVIKYNSTTKQTFIGDQAIDPARLANLKAERAFILESDVWRLLVETPKAEAHLSMFVNGQSLNDMLKGKAMLFVLDQQSKILNKFV